MLLQIKMAKSINPILLINYFLDDNYTLLLQIGLLLTAGGVLRTGD
jgi:hypothetical protein